MSEEFSDPLVPADFSECHCVQSVVTWSLGSSSTGSALASVRGLCLPGHDGHFCFAFLSCFNCFRASHHFCSASLACCALTRKVPREFFLLRAFCTLFCCWSSSRFPLFTGKGQLSPHLVDPWCCSESPTPQKRSPGQGPPSWVPRSSNTT